MNQRNEEFFTKGQRCDGVGVFNVLLSDQPSLIAVVIGSCYAELDATAAERLIGSLEGALRYVRPARRTYIDHETGTLFEVPTDGEPGR
jgi:hypothetical protein